MLLSNSIKLLLFNGSGMSKIRPGAQKTLDYKIVKVIEGALYNMSTLLQPRVIFKTSLNQRYEIIYTTENINQVCVKL